MKIIFLIRSIVAMILFVIFTAVLSSGGVISNLIFNRRRYDNWVVNTWGKGSCWLFNIKVIVHNIENIQSTPKGAIFLFNHSSFMDILAMAGYFYNVRFGAKIELFSLPFFGACIRRFGTLPIARQNKDEVIKVYEEAKVRFARGERFGLSPEGGRFHGAQLFPFKAGPFIFAMTSKVPLIPVVLKGAYETWPKGQMLANADRWSREIHIHVLKPIATENLVLENRSELQEQIYKLMNDVYIKN